MIFQNNKCKFKTQLLLIVLLTISNTSCQKDEDFYLCPKEVSPYLDNFKLEAESRGIKIQWSGLKVELLNHPVCNGNAGCYNHDTHTISLDTTSNNFKFSRFSKEAIIYHELSHALLKRGHKNNLLPNLEPASIMNCCESVSYTNSIFKREYYINELFHESELCPEWAH